MIAALVFGAGGCGGDDGTAATGATTNADASSSTSGSGGDSGTGGSGTGGSATGGAATGGSGPGGSGTGGTGTGGAGTGGSGTGGAGTGGAQTGGGGAGASGGGGGGPQPVQIKNPVYDGNFADPAVVKVGSTWHAYATGGGQIRHRTSTNLQVWKLADHVLTKPNGKWVVTDNPEFWAPGIAMVKADHFVLYFAANAKQGGKCIGRATSKSPNGPFVDDYDGPMHCDNTPGHNWWAIDPSPFEDSNGDRYLLWRQDKDGNSHVAIRKLGPMGEYFAPGSEVKIILSRTPGSWEDSTNPNFGKLIENPAMVKHGGEYYLFYSGNSWQTASYATGYATCKTPVGPCTKITKSGPWLESSGKMKGPGGLDIFKGPGQQTWAVWHSWFGEVGPDKGMRQLFVGELTFGSAGAPKLDLNL